jgi:hypothetical protein
MLSPSRTYVHPGHWPLHSRLFQGSANLSYPTGVQVPALQKLNPLLDHCDAVHHRHGDSIRQHLEFYALSARRAFPRPRCTMCSWDTLPHLSHRPSIWQPGQTPFPHKGVFTGTRKMKPSQVCVSGQVKDQGTELLNPKRFHISLA